MRVLFLCIHNSSRSQMAEGFLQTRGGKRYQVFSVGTHPRSVHPLAFRAMAELSIDIIGAAEHRPKSLLLLALQIESVSPDYTLSQRSSSW